jgi:phosphotriesterase-related protein
LSHLKYQGGKGYGYLLEVFVPMLKERGVSEEQIHQMLVSNPAKVLSRPIQDTESDLDYKIRQ